MTERKDEKWLDSQLRRAVDGATPVFDAEAWKQEHRDEYQKLILRSTTAQASGSRIVLRTWTTRLAVAATVAVVVGLFFLGRSGHGPDQAGNLPGSPTQASPVRMMSMMSLRVTYQQGGFEALDQQLQDTLDEFRPRSSSVPIRGLFSM